MGGLAQTWRTRLSQSTEWEGTAQEAISRDLGCHLHPPRPNFSQTQFSLLPCSTQGGQCFLPQLISTHPIYQLIQIFSTLSRKSMNISPLPSASPTPTQGDLRQVTSVLWTRVFSSITLDFTRLPPTSFPLQHSRIYLLCSLVYLDTSLLSYPNNLGYWSSFLL